MWYTLKASCAVTRITPTTALWLLRVSCREVCKVSDWYWIPFLVRQKVEYGMHFSPLGFCLFFFFFFLGEVWFGFHQSCSSRTWSLLKDSPSLSEECARMAFCLNLHECNWVKHFESILKFAAVKKKLPLGVKDDEIWIT